MILRWAMIFCLVFASVPVAHADDASKQAKVHELFQIMKLDQISAQMMNQAMGITHSVMSQQLSGLKITPDQQQNLNTFRAKVEKYVMDTQSWQNLEPQYAKIYADIYTEQEIDDMVAFYRSPTGRAVIEKSPLVIKESSAMAQQNMAAMLPVIQKMTNDFIAQESVKSSQKTAKTAK